MLAGYEELFGGINPVRNQEIFGMNNKIGKIIIILPILLMLKAASLLSHYFLLFFFLGLQNLL